MFEVILRERKRKQVLWCVYTFCLDANRFTLGENCHIRVQNCSKLLKPILGLVKKFDHRWITNLERLSERELKYVKKLDKNVHNNEVGENVGDLVCYVTYQLFFT